MRCAGAPRFPSPSPFWQRVTPAQAPWGAGRPRDAAARAAAEAAGRVPRGLRASCGAGWWGLCYKNYVCAPCRGVTPPSLLFPRCSWVAADIFIYWFFFFFPPPRLVLLFGGSGRESRQLLPRSSPRRSRGLCSRSRAGAAGSPSRPLPTDSGRFPLRPGPGGGGLPAVLPQPREGWLWGRDAPRPFLPGASSLFPRGPAALPSRFSLAVERRQTGWPRPDPSVSARRAGSRARQRNSCPSAQHSLVQPLSALGLWAKWRNGGKEKSFFNSE